LAAGSPFKITITTAGKPLVGRVKHVGRGFTFTVELAEQR
jgi:hypothetical protein